MPRRSVAFQRWQVTVFLLAIALAFYICIAQIQASRQSSCERTYHSFPLMFEPFFPKKLKDRTPKQNHDHSLLQVRADELADGCKSQITPVWKFWG